MDCLLLLRVLIIYKRHNMYKIVCVSSGIVVATFNDLSYAKDWLADNNTLSGEPANLFKIVKSIEKAMK